MVWTGTSNPDGCKVHPSGFDMHLYESRFDLVLYGIVKLGNMFLCYVYHCLYMQQSATFKILQTRLKTVPSYALNSEQLKRALSVNPYSQILQIADETNKNHDAGNMYSTINFPSRVQQFQNMQQRHRMHMKMKLQYHHSTSSTLSQVWGHGIL